MGHVRPLLILDLDETLVYASSDPFACEPDFVVGPYSVLQRPGLQAFLDDAAQWFDLAVWTSSSPLYARAICNAIFPGSLPLAFCWASDRCTLRRDLQSDTWVQAKHLSKLKRHGYALERVLVVDDSPEKHRRNYGNLVRVHPFEGDPNDQELPLLTQYLAALHTASNFRRIEKRFWRERLLQNATTSVAGPLKDSP